MTDHLRICTIKHKKTYMKTKILLLIALFAACIIPSFTHAGEDGEGEKKGPDPAKMFKKLDADKSGSISSEEAAARKGLAKRFEKLDKDGSGDLSMDEFKASMVKKPKKESKDEEEE